MLTLLLLIVPLIAGLFLLLNKSKSNFTPVVYIGIAVQLAIFVYAFINFKSNPSLLNFDKAWLPDFAIRFHLGLDGLSILMVGLSVVLVSLILLAVKGLKYENMSHLLGLIFLTQAALIGVFSAKDIFLFYFFFELALVPVYLIANFWGGENSSKITFKMLIYTVFGSLFMLVSFIFLYMRGQSSDIDSLRVTVTLLPNAIKQVLFWGLLLAFAIKMPVFPFHTWLPDAYSQSPTPATMLLSGLLSKMGVYGLIRILLPFAPDGINNYGGIVITLAIIGLIYGSIIAIKQSEIKRLIAYSSFAHMGLMAATVLTLSVSGMQGAIFQMVAHGFNAVGLFYIAKLIFEKTGSRNLAQLGGMTQTAPKLSIMFMIVLLGSIGLPLTNGFIGEFLMLKSVFDFNTILGVIAGLSVIFGAVYMLRFFQKTMFGPLSESATEISDIGSKELAILIPIAIVVIVTGVFPNLILNVSGTFVNTLTNLVR
ncbi:NADH-quinone oxidoreductase subunit M [Lacihabitans sp. LS3-19]|uniref:complex I subunit 4 family protein n=1 Tax=Lacihabitans sp. LS3-19 TaxID=2487335 RepID=UPI0020CF705E|nr:NADH-quinone oxidoreductase subunit M [Lacihabitans sp. LS3-19]MCP9767744.1 NADH-quinone oxidoreductase subunit M [Lacihabitans sp. LS3-19]